MGQAWKKIQKHKQAKDKLSELMAKAEQVVVIHYSCESFYNRPDGSSPRITSIAVRNLEFGQTTSFSIHQIAERKRYSPNELDQHYNQQEKEILDEFSNYVDRHYSHTWLHWNMSNKNYGFPAIEHRHKVLGGEPKLIHENQWVDLSRLLLAIYGDDYISYPRSPSLVKLNARSHKYFLDGKSEAEAFNKKEYVKLHQSTLRKVDVIAKIAERADDGSLKTQSSWIDICGNYFVAFFELIKEHPVISGVITLVGLVGAFSSFF